MPEFRFPCQYEFVVPFESIQELRPLTPLKLQLWVTFCVQFVESATKVRICSSDGPYSISFLKQFASEHLWLSFSGKVNPPSGWSVDWMTVRPPSKPKRHSTLKERLHRRFKKSNINWSEIFSFIYFRPNMCRIYII